MDRKGSTMIRKFKTNLRCGGCVSTIRPLLDAAPGIKSWRADVDSPDKVLTVEGDTVSRVQVGELLERAGYQILDELPVELPKPTYSAPPAADLSEPKASYYPLALIVAYILGVV